MSWADGFIGLGVLVLLAAAVTGGILAAGEWADRRRSRRAGVTR